MLGSMKIGILDDIMKGKRPELGWLDLLPLAAKKGFAGFEFGVGQNYEESMLWNAAGRRELVEAAKKAGIEIASVCVHSYWHYSFANDDAEVRARAARIAQQAATATAEVGAVNILVPLTSAKDVADAIARERWIEGVRSVAKYAEDAGVIFCLENVNQAFANKPEDVAAIVDAVDSPAVGVYYDPGNAVHSGEDPIHGITVLGKRIKQSHVKEVGGMLLGEGTVPWPQIMDAYRKVGYDGWMILETNPTDDPESAASHNLDFVAKLI